MQFPTNTFKQALQEGRAQIGLWAALADAYATEAIAGTGFDWLLIDAEHGPNDLRGILAQLQAAAPYPAHPIVRPPTGDIVLIKQLLELGAQTLLIPMIESAEQAAAMVAAVRYPPQGVRGVGSGIARSGRWGAIDNYAHQANAQMCVLLQVESRKGIDNLAAIAAVEGVDGVFCGPAGLAASFGLLGQPDHPDVVAAVRAGIAAVCRAGKAAGVLTMDHALSRQYLQDGASFVAVGVDILLMVQGCRALAAAFKPELAAGPRGGAY
jgi:4-hydroxy-2-oxoheptanedioate aldolase